MESKEETCIYKGLPNGIVEFKLLTKCHVKNERNYSRINHVTTEH